MEVRFADLIVSKCGKKQSVKPSNSTEIMLIVICPQCQGVDCDIIGTLGNSGIHGSGATHAECLIAQAGSYLTGTLHPGMVGWDQLEVAGHVRDRDRCCHAAVIGDEHPEAFLFYQLDTQRAESCG